jgi:uncharacterized membrane protein required for colicin V production
MLDVGIAISLIVLALYGVSAGLILAVIDMIALLLGIFIAGLLYDLFAGVLVFIPDERVAKIVAFVIIVVVVIIAAEILTKIFKVRAKVPIKKLLDSLLGGIVGLLWGAIIVSTLIRVWVGLSPDIITTTDITDSILVNILINYIPIASALLPQEFSEVSSYFK